MGALVQSVVVDPITNGPRNRSLGFFRITARVLSPHLHQFRRSGLNVVLPRGLACKSNVELPSQNNHKTRTDGDIASEADLHS